MKTFTSSKKGVSQVLGLLMVVMVIFASGFIFCNFVINNVNFAKTIFNSQMQSLLLQYINANTTHIVAFIKNAGANAVEFTMAYVDGLLVAIQEGKATISASTVGAAAILGAFVKGNSYTVKLTNIFNLDLSFAVTI